MPDKNEYSQGKSLKSDEHTGKSFRADGSSSGDGYSNSSMKILVIVLVCGVLGVAVGCTRLLSWHHAIESAQVLAGIVKYPPDNPFYIYHTKIWSLFIQLSALGLYVGIPERTLAYVISALLSFIAFLACSLCVFAFSKRLFWSLISPWILMAYMIDLTYKAGLIYPLSMAGTHFSYGTLALSMVFLSVALFGVGHNRIGALFLGVAPAFHVVVGFSSWPLLLMCVLWQRQSTTSPSKQIIAWFFIGAVVCAASLSVHLLMKPDLPGISPESTAAYLDAFFKYWNVHHKPVSITSPGFWLNLAVAAMGLIWLRYYSDLVPKSALVILRALAVFGFFGLIMAAVNLVPQDILPQAVRQLMPSRFINFNVYLAPAVIVGLLASRKNLISSAALFCFFILVPLMQLPRQGFFGTTAAGLVTVYCVLACLVPKWSHIGIRCNSFVESCFRIDRRGLTTILTLAISVLVLGGLYVYHFHKNRLEYEIGKWSRNLEGDWSNDPFFRKISSTDGIVAVASIPVFQLRSRRPILLDNDINMLGYVPECGPSMELILKEVYGLDTFNPPPGAYSYGSMDKDLYRETWEGRSPEQWVDIRKRLGVTLVVTAADWRLNLPELIKNSSYKAYSIQ